MLTSERSELVVALCQALIQQQSYSGHEDGVVERMRQAFAELKFDEVLTDEYGSVLGRVKGKRPGKVLLLDGHIDTVPVPDESKWTHKPYGGEVEDGRIYGRGDFRHEGRGERNDCGCSIFCGGYAKGFRRRNLCFRGCARGDASRGLPREKSASASSPTTL